MASFTKRGKTWQYNVSVKTGDNQYKSIRKGGFRTKKEAESAAHQIEVEVAKGYNPVKKEMLLADYFKNWMEIYKKPFITDLTYRKYKTTFNNIKIYLPFIRLMDLDRETYQKALNKFAKSHTVTTTKVFNNHLKACLNDALEDKVILYNPANRALITGETPVKNANEKYLEFDDFKALIHETYKRLGQHHSHYLILIMAYTGCRLAEAQGLTWDNINYEDKTLLIEKTWLYKLKEPVFAPTKNRENRTIFITDPLIKLLKDYHQMQVDQGILIDRIIPETLSANGVNKTLKNIQKHLNISPAITSHGLRHTHASVLLMNDVNILNVSERLGHRDITVTQSTYSHLLCKLKEKDLPKIQAALDF